MKRWPVIRHVRYFWLRRQVWQHYQMWLDTTGALPVYADRDQAVLDAIWRGER